MEFTGAMSGLSPKKDLRAGQKEVLTWIETNPDQRRLRLRLPTGYGKTFCAALAYAAKQRQNHVDRILCVVPKRAQLAQYINDAHCDFIDADVLGNPRPFDIETSPVQAVRNHRSGKSQIFVCTIQALSHPKSAVRQTVKLLLQTGKWMILFDEHHHYGVDCGWGITASEFLALCLFMLAMSATPDRPDDDGAFGDCDIEVKYREAFEQRAVKRLRCHSYVYRIDAEMPDGSSRTFTTEQLADEAGSKDPEAIEKFRIERQMRWSPKYVSPLVSIPIERLLDTKIRTGLPCQAIVGTMCCSHAEMVYEQITAMFPGLRIDWVGTGSSGRTEEENNAVLEKFNPMKKDGRRRPEDVKLDVLVHVGMAAEGVDTTFVTEVIHLNPANINNQNNQENGRAARLLPLPEEDWAMQVAYINVDSCSEYAKYIGDSVMDAMDLEPPHPKSDEDEDDAGDPSDLPPLPPEMTIRIWDMECIRVDDGQIRRMAEAYKRLDPQQGRSIDERLADPDDPIHGRLAAEYKKMLREEAEKANDSSDIKQRRAAVNNAVKKCGACAARLLHVPGTRFEKSDINERIKRVSKQRFSIFGSVDDSDVASLNAQYEWCVALEREIRNRNMPRWLA